MDEININDHSDPVTVLRALIAATNSNDQYSKGFRNALRFAIAVLTDTEPNFEN